MINSKNSEKSSIKSNDSINLKECDGLIQFKVVYWGPGESGKTTNFFRLREKFYSLKLTDGYSIETKDGRTLWQDSLFISFNFKLKDKKYNIIVQIVTCTGQERFLSTREYILDGADGIIFVGDSQIEKMEQNKRSFRELIAFAKRQKIPYILQLNKRDLKDIISIEDFKKHLGLPLMEKYPDGTLVVYPVIALEGKNVVQCFQDLIVQIIFHYFNSD
ncbi:MAG: ATP/GTP-binding protein [Candidatus Hermodarchaeota archaeon]